MDQKTIAVAIADDHNLLRHGLVNLINLFPNIIVVCEAENGIELIQNLSSINHCDICILDISMPKLNGYDTLLALKKLYPKMKFLILTLYENEYSIIKMIKSGANGYLLKNCKSEELQEALNEIYTNGYYYSKTASESAFNAVKNNPFPNLTEKEMQLIRLSCTELSYIQIAEQMHISVRTVEDYQKVLSKKLNIHNRIGLAIFAIHTGLISLSKGNRI